VETCWLTRASSRLATSRPAPPAAHAQAVRRMRRNVKFLDALWQRRYKIYKVGECLAVTAFVSLVYVWLSPWPGNATDRLRWAGNLLLANTEFLVYFGLFLSLKYNILRWSQTVRIVGFPSAEIRRAMRHLEALRKEKYPISFPALFLGLAILVPAFVFTGVRLFLAVATVLCANCAIEPLRRIVPPTILILTCSSPQGVALHAKVSWTIRRLRAVALLRMEDSPTHFLKTLVRRDCYRTDSDAAWEQVVDDLMRICPLLVLDTREESKAVTEEIMRIASARLAYKLMMVVESTGERPVVDALPDLSSSLCGAAIVRESGALTMLQYLTRPSTGLPSSAKPIESIIRSSPVWQVVRRGDWKDYGETGAAPRAQL
jgi:hypothetical protein